MSINHKPILSLLILIICLSIKSNAQDIHFSQYMTAPQIINASLAGYYNEDWRVTGNYRRQWAALGFPLTTYSLSADAPFYIQNNKLATGFIFINDNSQLLNFQQNLLYGNLAYHHMYKNHYFRIGIQPGVSFNSYNPNQLSLPEQYNMYTGTYDSSLPITEDLSTTKFIYLDVNAAASWSTNVRNITILSGLSAFHINRPYYGFNNTERIPVRWLFNSMIETTLTPFIKLQPSIVYVKQASASEFLAGSLVEIKLKNKIKDLTNINAGLFLRHSLFENIDALILSLGLKYAKIETFVAYDFVISNLRTATNYRGSVEIAVVLKGLMSNNKDTFIPCTIQ